MKTSVFPSYYPLFLLFFLYACSSDKDRNLISSDVALQQAKALKELIDKYHPTRLDSTLNKISIGHYYSYEVDSIFLHLKDSKFLVFGNIDDVYSVNDSTYLLNINNFMLKCDRRQIRKLRNHDKGRYSKYAVLFSNLSIDPNPRLILRQDEVYSGSPDDPEHEITFEYETIPAIRKGQCIQILFVDDYLSKKD